MLKRVVRFFICTYLFLIMGKGSAESISPCFLYLSDASDLSEEINITDRFMSYLGTLLDKGLVDHAGLNNMLQSSVPGQLENPIDAKQARINIALQIHRDNIQDYINNSNLNVSQISNWIQKAVQARNKIKNSREQIANEIKDVHHKMEFFSVPPGNVKRSGGEEDIVFKNSLSVMSTKVTQKMWAEVMGFNPSKFKDGPDSVTLNVNGKLIQMQPDYPVENINWWSAVTFANKLSEMHNLKPAYDLSKIEWVPGTSAAFGNLTPKSGDSTAMNLMENPDKYSKVYENSEGYRLGTMYEKMYLMSNLSAMDGKYPHNIDRAELADYAWFSENAEGRTYPVGTTKKNFSINGHIISDLIGNVWEWCDYIYFGGAFPAQNVQLQGGAYDAWDWRLSTFPDHDPMGIFNREASENGIGLRLYRTVKSK